jgi:hypothetical protein
MYSLLGSGFWQWGFSLLCPCSTAPVLTGWRLTANDSSVGRLGKLLLGLASTVIPGSGSYGIHDHIFFYLMTLGIMQLLTVPVGQSVE